MKVAKLMTTIALAATLIGVFTESAAAITRGTGSAVRGRRINPVEVDFTFELFELTPTGNPRMNEDSGGTRGRFTGAIENFTGGIDDLTSGSIFDFDEVTVVKSTVTESCSNSPPLSFCIKNPLTLDLRTELIENRRIEYILTSNELRNTGVNEIALTIDGRDETDLKSIVGNPIQAIDSISYIVNNQLLGKVNSYEVRGKCSSCELGITSSGGPITGSSESDSISVATVPEAGATRGMLASGILILGILLKRKIKRSRRLISE
ncbi:MAG: hypothetical protein HC769_24300 [Cyanobacteria bacterium CRU_2_1]|nr:hypothetical protein [Cyanobacteria bacterium RU_5_0]NJR61680.1 hypothetical protein [Cyanobacteria bacterium CRU_2_1]